MLHEGDTQQLNQLLTCLRQIRGLAADRRCSSKPAERQRIALMLVINVSTIQGKKTRGQRADKRKCVHVLLFSAFTLSLDSLKTFSCPHQCLVEVTCTPLSFPSLWMCTPSIFASQFSHLVSLHPVWTCGFHFWTVDFLRCICSFVHKDWIIDVFRDLGVLFGSRRVKVRVSEICGFCLFDKQKYRLYLSKDFPTNKIISVVSE